MSEISNVDCCNEIENYYLQTRIHLEQCYNISTFKLQSQPCSRLFVNKSSLRGQLTTELFELFLVIALEVLESL